MEFAESTIRFQGSAQFAPYGVYILFYYKRHSYLRLLPKATFHLTISMRAQRATGKIQRNNYHHWDCGPSLTSKTMSVFLIFTQGTHRNAKNR